ncbi:MAG: hypothetical protein MJ132_02795 [Clostridia bacterium]|nr:hypothetical protein [Clostridia bacterium]
MKKRLLSIAVVLAILSSIFTMPGLVPVAATVIDITDSVTVEDAGTIISADTTTLFLKLGNYSCLPESGAGFFSNDNPTVNGIDVLSYVEINGVSARDIVNANHNGDTSFAGSVFPMNIGGIYSPIMEFCENPYFRFSILTSYLPQGAFTFTLKSGFSWTNKDGKTLVTSADVTYAYSSTGAFQKVTQIADIHDELRVADYVTTADHPEYAFIDLRTDSSVFGGYDYKFFDTAYGSACLLPYVEINGESLAEINRVDISGYGTTWTMFPASVSANYQTAVLPFAENGTTVKLRILKAWLDDYIAECDGNLIITLKSGLRSMPGTTLYVNGQDQTFTYNFETASFEHEGAEQPNGLTLSKGTVVHSADYAQVGILAENAGNLRSIGYHFSEIKSDYPNVVNCIFVNGKSVAQINEEYNGSYTYTEFPATVGRNYQDPVYLFADDGVIWIKIAKAYVKTLPADFEITFSDDFGYDIEDRHYGLDTEQSFAVEKIAIDRLRWLSYTETSNFGISVFNNSTVSEGYQSFNIVFDREIPAFSGIAYDAFTENYYAMTERIFVGGKSVAQINAETSTVGYAFNYFPANVIDSFKTPIILYVSGNNMELKINSAYYNAIAEEFSVVLKPDFFTVIDNVKYTATGGFAYISNKEHLEPTLVGGTTEYLDIRCGDEFFPTASVGTVFSPVGGEVAMRITESDGRTSLFGGLLMKKRENGIFRINLMNANVVKNAVLTVDAAYMLGTDGEYLGPVSFIYTENGWRNLLTSSDVPKVESIVPNGGFDTSVSGWSKNIDKDTLVSYADGFNGQAAAVQHIATTGEEENGIVSPAFTLQANTAYRVYVHVFTEGRTQLGIAVEDGDRLLGGTQTFAALRENSNGWKLLEYRFTTPRTTSAARIALKQRFFAENAIVVYDDVLVCKDFAIGDVNADASVDVRDLVRFKKALVGTAAFFEESLADLDENLIADIYDMIALHKVLLGMDIKSYTYEKDSNGTSLHFKSSNQELDTFLNDFYVRQFSGGANSLRGVELGSYSTAWKAWEAQSMLWYNSTTDNFKTDKFEAMRTWLYSIPVDDYGYVWSSFNNLENPAVDPAGQFGMGWPFPNYGAYKDYDWEFNSGKTEGWSVTGASTSSVGSGYYKTTVSNATELSYNISSWDAIIKTAESPFLEMDLRWDIREDAVDDITVSWKNQLLRGTWQTVSVKDYSVLPQTYGTHYAEHIYLPMYLHKEWGKNKSIYDLKITVTAKSGKTLTGNINLNYVRGNLDSRQVDNAYNFLETARLYYEYTGDAKTLRDNLNRYRSACMFMIYNLAGDDGMIDLSNFCGHDGGIRTDSRNHTIASSYWDILSLPTKSVYAQTLYYRCLEDLAYLENAAEQNEISISPATVKNFDRQNIYWHLSVADINQLAQSVQSAVQQPVNYSAKTGYFDSTKGRFIDGFNRMGNPVDYGSVIFNNMAVSFGLATDAQAASVLSWINGERTVAGDTVTGSDIYAYEFAPRTTTVKNSSQYVSDYSSAEANAAFGSSVQDGGAVLFTGYYDLLARAQYSGIENAFVRLCEIKDWYLKVLSAFNGSTYSAKDFYRAYYNQQGIALQGDGTAGALGLDREFIENAVLCSAIPEAFFGLSGKTSETLSIRPQLPEGMTYWRMENLRFHRVNYDLEIGSDYVILESVSGNRYGLKVNIELKTEKRNPTVFVNGRQLDSADYTVIDGSVCVTTDFVNQKIEIR